MGASIAAAIPNSAAYEGNGLLTISIPNTMTIANTPNPDASAMTFSNLMVIYARNFCTARAGQIAHINRSMPHSRDKKNTGIRYCTLSVRH